MPSIGVNLRVTGHCSQGGRKYMEDFFSVAYQQSLSDERDLEYAFIGIYDGHGGAEAATYAKEHLINLIVNQKLFWSDDEEDVLRAIREGYIATHYAMWREQGKWPKTASGLPSTAGTTASVAFIRHGKIYIGHVGDSGIVLGYQNDNERIWRAKQLTMDHKPESHVEKTRIMNSGGKVVNKAGVPRVVWNRPRIGHKGPVRRSTPIDEIPFLAVARSLGDLWSYNSALNEFVVSPEPDVLVVKIDPKRFKCLVFGTDGLWNVVSPQAAVDSVRYTESINERSACDGESKEWVNPSKYLVDKALERWSTRKMRADNTSVVIIMLDPPGPPKRDVIKSSAPSYSMDYLEDEVVNQPSQALEIEPIQNFTMFDHSTNEHIDMDGMPLPTSGLTVLTRYENIIESDVQTHNQQQAYETAMDIESNEMKETYMDSFAESYNSLLNSSLDSDPSYVYENEDDSNSKDDKDYQYDETNTTHQYNESFTSTESVYSLTKLQTRTERQYDMYASTSSDPMPSTSRAMYTDYQQNLVDHNYIGDSEYASTSSGYSGSTSNETSPSSKRSIGEGLTSAILSMMPSILRSHLPASLASGDANKKSRQTPEKNIRGTHRTVDPIVQKEKMDAAAQSTLQPDASKTNRADNSIQINEISSSDNNESISEDGTTLPRLKRLTTLNSKKTDSASQPILPTKKASKTASPGPLSKVRVTRSSGNIKKTRTSVVNLRNPKTKVATIHQKQQNNNKCMTRRTHKENISDIVRKLPLTRTRNLVTVTQFGATRTLRSQNALIKDSPNKAANARTSQNQMQNIQRNATLAQETSPTGRNTNGKANSNSNIAGNNAKGPICKKLPKRLLNEYKSVQMNKSNNNSNKQMTRRSASPVVQGTNKKSSIAQQSPTLRWKVLVAKKPLIANQCNQLVTDRTTITTRRTRLNH